jgi:AraC-like DNA-binding protein
MEEYLYILILSAAIVFTCISYFINIRLVSPRKSQKILGNFLLFIIAHCVLTIIVRFCFAEDVFVYLGLPLGFFYAPYLYSCFIVFLKEYKETQGEISEESDVLRHIYLHFLPGVVYTLGYVIALIKADTENVEFLVNYYLLYYISLGMQLILYATFGYFAISKLNLPKHIRLVILRVIWIMIFVGIIAMGLILYNAIPNNDGNILYIAILCLSMVLFFYYIERLKKDEVFISQGGVIKEVVEKVEVESVVVELNKYEKSKFSEEFANEYKAKIEKVILKDQLYLKPTCSLEAVEKLAKIQKHHLSQFFSTEYGKHFNAYINELRIEYAKNVLIERDYNVSVSELGEECGFNSRTSFFRAFKKYVGVSPSEYIENQQSQNDKQQ